MSKRDVLLALSLLSLVGCGHQGLRVANASDWNLSGQIQVLLSDEYALSMRRPRALVDIEHDETGLTGESGVSLYRSCDSCGEGHVMEAFFFGLTPAIDGSCLPVAQRQREELRDLGEWGCESMRVGALICSGSSPNSVCRFRFRQNCVCPNGLPMVGRVEVRMSDVPGQCLVAAGNWPRATNRRVSRAFRHMFKGATVTRIE